MTPLPPIPPMPPADAELRPESRFTVLLGDERDASEPWHRTAVGLLGAQGVRTVVAETGKHALGLIERGVRGEGPRIHVAVLEQRMSDMTALQVLRRLQEHAISTPSATEKRQERPTAAPSAVPPAILLAHQNDRGGGLPSGLMHDALTVRVFSVLPRPVDTNLLLDTLARALRRFYAGRWPNDNRKAEG